MRVNKFSFIEREREREIQRRFKMDEDDLRDHGGGLELEQRSTDRLLNDLRTNGYRDARQKFMEDETLMQAGFDAAYTQLVRLGFLVGQVRASSNSIVRDSATLAAINHRLDAIEKFAFENRVHWSNDSSSPLSCQFIQSVQEFSNMLSELSSSLKTTQTPSIATLNHLFAQLDSRLAGELTSNCDLDLEPNENHIVAALTI